MNSHTIYVLTIAPHLCLWSATTLPSFPYIPPLSNALFIMPIDHIFNLLFILLTSNPTLFYSLYTWTISPILFHQWTMYFNSLYFSFITFVLLDSIFCLPLLYFMFQTYMMYQATQLLSCTIFSLYYLLVINTYVSSSYFCNFLWFMILAPHEQKYAIQTLKYSTFSGNK